MSHRIPARLSRAAALAVACTLAVSLAACKRTDPVQAEIDRVSIGLDAISTSGGNPLPSVEQRRRVYEWAINRLSGRSSPFNAVESNIADTERELPAPSTGRPATSVADSAPSNPPAVDAKNPGQAAAANLLLARGHAGLAEISAQDAASLEARSLGLVPAARVALDQWLALNAAADAQAAFNPAPEIARIEAQIAERQKQADDQRAAKDRQLAVIRGLEKQSDDLAAQVRSMREQEVALRASALNASETRRLEILTEVNRLRREADQVEMQAANLIAQAALEKPKADEMQARIDEYTLQAQLLGEERETVRKRGQDLAAAAQAARTEARAAADRIASIVAEIEAARKAVDAPTEAAIRGYTQAAAAARKAVNSGPRESQSVASSAAGNFQHLLGEVHGAHAFGQRTIAELLRAIASAKPALPQSDAYAAKAGEFETSAASSDKASKDAYRDAAGSYTKAGSESLAAAMNKLAGEADAMPEETGAPTDPAPAAGDAAADGTTMDPPVQPAGASAGAEAEVRAAIDRMIGASRAADMAALKGMIALDNPEARTILDAMIDASDGPAKLNAAAVATYGKSLKELIDASQVQSVKSNPLLVNMLQQIEGMNVLPGDLDTISAADAVIVMDGESRATVTLPGSDDDVAEPQALNFVKHEGAWKLDADSMLQALGGAQGLSGMAPMLGVIQAMGGAFSAVHTKLAAGEYADADRMLIDLNTQLMAAMMKAGGMGGPGEGPGGG